MNTDGLKRSQTALTTTDRTAHTEQTQVTAHTEQTQVTAHTEQTLVTAHTEQTQVTDNLVGPVRAFKERLDSGSLEGR